MTACSSNGFSTFHSSFFTFKSIYMDSSEYTEDINNEIDSAALIPVESGFSGMHECYVSENGHTRLFRATRYGKLYMLKCLKPDFLYTPIYRQALTKEFEIGLQLDHPNICRTIGMEEVDGLGATIVMEYIDGETLADMIDGKVLTAQMAEKVARQLADALDYMHGKQITHRDLKPSNIMVTHNGHNVKLIDFGLADSDGFNVLKQPAGTSGYIAPEQLLPGAKADVCSDIYSLGMVMRDMAAATGDRAMADIATACTRRNPADRPATVQQIFERRRPSRTQRLTVTLLVVIIAALAVLITATMLSRQSRQAETTPAGYVMPDGNEAVDYSQWPRK